MLPIRRSKLVPVLGISLALTVAWPAHAVTDGERDVEDDHPYVVVVYNFVEARIQIGDAIIEGIVPAWGCSGSVIEEDLVLTAGHCTGEFVPGLEPVASWVLFGKDLSDFDQVLDQILEDLVAETFDVWDPPSVAHLSIEEIVTGVPDAHDRQPALDIGVVTLDEPVSAAVYGPFPDIAPLGYLEALERTTPRSEIELTLVGYGSQRVQVVGAEIHPVTGDPVVVTVHDQDGWRHVGSANIVTLRSQRTGDEYLHHTANPGRWSGGTCFGDSGGPVLHEGTIVGLTSHGLGNPMCRGNTSFAFRTDIEAAHDYLAPFR